MRVLLTLLLLCSYRNAFGEEPTRFCAVTFRVITRTGEPVPYRVRLLNDRMNRDYTGNFQQLTARVPCGSYTYELIRSDVETPHGRLLGKLEIRDPEEWHTLVTDQNLLITEKGT